MSLRNSPHVRRIVRAIGIDPRRFAFDRPLPLVVRQIRHHAVTCVLDVGANDGGYARSLRTCGYTGNIVSFEPTRQAFERARVTAASDKAWQVLNLALGPETGEVTINVAGNASQSSSILDMHGELLHSSPASKTVSTEQVAQRTLDEIWDSLVGTNDVAFLKLDVQGYERHVLAGAAGALANPQLVGLQMEMTPMPLYEGAWALHEALGWAQDRGFTLERIVPGFTDRNSGRMLEADGIFFRNDSSRESNTRGR